MVVYHQGQSRMREAIEDVEHRVIEEMSEALSQPFTEEEVTKALFQMHPIKAPEPDGGDW